MPERFTPYQRKLFVFLSVATFFEGYDFLALTQILPNLRADMGLTETEGGALVGVINAGTIVAYLLIRLADRIGRRRVLTITILGYASFSFLSGLAPNAVVFALLQLVARVFLIGEWAISMVYAAEEFPADRRGMVIGIIQAFSSLGAIVCAGVVPLLLETTFGWRTVYFVGVVPLALLAFARRNLRETSRFEARTGPVEPWWRFWRILFTPYRGRMFQLALIWAITYVCTQNGVTFWKEFALGERGMTDGEVGLSITIAATASMPLVFLSSKLLDLVGRRMSAVIIFSIGALGVWGAYTLHDRWALTGALMLGIFGASAVLSVLNAYTAELFPTELRADAFAWSNNLLGRIGYVSSPFFIGAAASQVGWGRAVSVTAICPIIALVLILALLPETRGRELEDTSSTRD